MNLKKTIVNIVCALLITCHMMAHAQQANETALSPREENQTTSEIAFLGANLAAIAILLTLVHTANCIFGPYAANAIEED